MSAKKPAVKIKEKTSTRVEAVAATKEKVSHRVEAAATKRTPAAEAKPTLCPNQAGAPAMDARSNKDRRQNDRRHKELPVEANRRSTERRVKVTRRRQIDPTTCERDYSPEEIEFMGALDDYKRRSGRMFPTCSEILEVFKALGYQKQCELPTIAPPATAATMSSVTSEQAV